MGPIIGGPLLQQFGPSGLLVLAAPALLIGLNAAWRLKKPMIAPRQTVKENIGLWVWNQIWKVVHYRLGDRCCIAGMGPAKYQYLSAQVSE